MKKMLNEIKVLDENTIVENSEVIKGRISPDVVEIRPDSCYGRDKYGEDLEFSHTIESRFLFDEACKAVFSDSVIMEGLIKHEGAWYAEVSPIDDARCQAISYVKIANA